MIEADICDFDACVDAMRGVDFVLHQAALGSVPRSIEQPLETHRNNADGTVHVFLAALRAKIARVVYASSSSVYGDEPTLPEERRPDRPSALALRGLETRWGDLRGRVRAHPWAVGGRLALLQRRGCAAGPERAVRRGDPALGGDARARRAAGAVRRRRDHARLLPGAERGPGQHPGGDQQLRKLRAACTTWRSAAAPHSTSCSRSCSAAWRRAGSLAPGMEPDYRPFRPGDIRHSLADIEAARRDLGYEPSTDLAQGLELVMDFFAKAPM